MTSVQTTPAQPASATLRLSVMMFLQFFLWGAWFVSLGPFMSSLGMPGASIGDAYSSAPVAAIIAPFFLGIVADRFFASQVVMGVLLLAGGGMLVLAPGLTANPNWFVAALLGHMLCYMPTLGLSNTIAFNAMSNPEKQFPVVRVFGTIGWIVAGTLVAYIAATMHPITEHLPPNLTLEQFNQTAASVARGETVPQAALTVFNETNALVQSARNSDPTFFYIAGGSSFLLGLFSFMLPNTPPPMRGKPFKIGSALGFDALGLLRDRSFLVFALASMLICIPLAAYYSFAGVYAGATGVADVPFKMTFGQMSEICFMLVMPLFFARLGVKWMLAVGMAAWAVRYGLFAFAWGGTPQGPHIAWMVLAGIILHGICYDFFFVTGQIYTEQRAPKEIRAQAQGFLVFLTQGVGMLIGAQTFGRLVDAYTVNQVTDWKTVWLMPTGFAIAILVVFVLAFKPSKSALA